MSQGKDFESFVLTEIRRDLEATKELAVGALALLELARDQAASAEAAQAKPPLPKVSPYTTV